MKNKEENIEQMLLEGASLDDLIKMKIEKEFKQEIDKSKQKPEKKVYTDISKTPRKLIFSKSALYKVFNRISKCETYIDGVQAEALIGIQNNVREKMLEGSLCAFTTEEAYVKFEKAEA